MKRKRLEKYLNKRGEHILNALAVFCLTKDPERIHQLRVEVKKINALVHLLDACSKDQSRQDLLKPLKKVYRKAALIRDAQVKLQLLAEIRIQNEAFEKEQKEIITVQAGLFCSEANRHQSRVEKVRKELAAHLNDMDNLCVFTTFRGWLDDLALFFSIDFTTDGLHDARKKLKDILYLHAFLPGLIIKDLNLNLPYFDELQNSIGRWHDSVLTTGLLSAQSLAGDTVLAQLQEQNNKLLENIKSLSADFISKARTEVKEYNDSANG